MRLKRIITALLLVLIVSTGIFSACKEDDNKTPCNHTGGTATCLNESICDLCKKAYGEKGDHHFEEGFCTVCDLPDPDYDDPNLPNIDEISFYNLPNGFRLRFEEGGDDFVEFIKLNDEYYTMAHRNNKVLGKFLFKKLDGTFSYYETQNEEWIEIKNNMTDKDIEKTARTMFMLILHKHSGSLSADTLTVDTQDFEVSTFILEDGTKYYLARGYDFWVKNTSDDGDFIPSVLNLNLLHYPEGIVFPDFKKDPSIGDLIW